MKLKLFKNGKCDECGDELGSITYHSTKQGDNSEYCSIVCKEANDD